ncbi:MAG: hypothetical protein JWR53_1849 [Glaciihabitans sp.]|nr:hypothetical protein [Glaciihabitans sp.]
MTKLFSAGDLRDRTEQARVRAVQSVSTVGAAKVRDDPEAVVLEISDGGKFVEIAYNFAAITRSDPIEVTIVARQFNEQYSIPGQAFDFHVPASGSIDLLAYKASRFSLGGAPDVTLGRGQISFRVSAPSLTAEDVRAEVERMQSRLQEMTAWTNHDISLSNDQLLSSVRSEVFARKKRLDDAAALAEDLEFPTA